jgi:putative sigma-54 modulation protein
MNIAITFRHLESSDAVKKYAQEKVAKLQKFLRQPMKASVTLSLERIEHVIEVGLSSGSDHYQAREQSEDMYASIDKVVDKLERQIRGAHGASVKKKRGGPRAGQFAAQVSSEMERED